jgi:hypothetical protein
MKRWQGWCCGTLLALGLLGCGPDDGDVRGELEVVPASTVLVGEHEESVILTVVVGEGTEAIVYPLEWSVSNPAIGRIVSQSADKAVYAIYRAVEAGNAITVRDQIGREGIALVSWKPNEDTD